MVRRFHRTSRQSAIPKLAYGTFGRLAGEWGMSFAWKRIRRHVASHGLPRRDPREVRDALGHFADAPAFRAAPAGFRVCPHDWNTVHGAAALGYLRILKRLLQNGEPADLRDSTGRTALAWAVEDGRAGAVELLLAFGADPTCSDESGTTPLHVAVGSNPSEILAKLLDAGADPDTGRDVARTPLMDAVAGRNAAAVELLLRRGADVHALDRHGQDVLFHLDSGGGSALLTVLMDAGARVGARNRDGDTARHVALRKGDSALWDMLSPNEDSDAWVEETGRFGDSALHAAVQGGCLPAVNRLIRAGADVNRTNRAGHSPLLVALTTENLAAQALLTKAGAQTGFLEAVAAGDCNLARQADLPTSVALDAPVAGMETPLMGAVARGRLDLVELLHANGASLDAGTVWIGSPLDVAALTGQSEMVRWLLGHGADPARATRVRAEMLHAMASDHDPVLPALPPLGSQRPGVDELLEAALAGDDAGLRFLRLCGADIDATDPDGVTALMRAVESSDSGAVRRLLAFGADPSKRDLLGRTAADRARERGMQWG